MMKNPTRQIPSFIDKSLCLFIASILSFTALANKDASDFMNGSPPEPSALVTKANWSVGPYNRWGLQHVREITATQEVSRGKGQVTRLKQDLLPISSLSVRKLDGSEGTIEDWLEASYTDGLLVLHKGMIVSEIYLNSMTEDSYHNFFSMSKSFTGTLAGILAERGQLDVGKKVSHYVPELADSAYGDATVRALLDMRIGINYSEDYNDPEADVYSYAAATNATPNPKQLSLYDVLPTFEKKGEHGQRFHYVTANTDALGWVLERAARRDLVEILTTEIWSRIGAERDGYVISDLQGTPWMGAGFNATLRDAGRFALMMLQGGIANRQQVVPASFVRSIQSEAQATSFPGISYRSQWWVDPGQNSFFARGVSGQRMIIVPEEDIVIVKFSSWPALAAYHSDGENYDRRAFQAVIDSLKRR